MRYDSSDDASAELGTPRKNIRRLSGWAPEGRVRR